MLYGIEREEEVVVEVYLHIMADHLMFCISNLLLLYYYCLLGVADIVVVGYLVLELVYMMVEHILESF
jgi:hypothetical protein